MIDAAGYRSSSQQHTTVAGRGNGQRQAAMGVEGNSNVRSSLAPSQVRSSVIGSAIARPISAPVHRTGGVFKPAGATTVACSLSSRKAAEARIKEEHTRRQDQLEIQSARYDLQNKLAPSSPQRTSTVLDTPQFGITGQASKQQARPASAKPASQRARQPASPARNSARGCAPSSAVPAPSKSTTKTPTPDRTADILRPGAPVRRAGVAPAVPLVASQVQPEAATVPITSPRAAQREQLHVDVPLHVEAGKQYSSLPEVPAVAKAAETMCMSPTSPQVPVAPAQIGKGVYARVRVTQGVDGRPVAVKTYDHTEAKEHACVAQHMKNEEKLAGKLVHENIIAPQAVQKRPGRTELVMEYAPGGNLGDYIKKNKGLPEAEARRIFAQIVSAVGYLHSQDICHRDIKLENIVLDKKMNARLVDFGAAKEGAHVFTRSVQGTPAYMAPEVARGAAHAGASADIWSLGVVLHTLLTQGQFPFWGKDLNELTRNITSRSLVVPPGLSGPCRDLLTKLLIKSAGQRMTIAQVIAHPWIAPAIKQVAPAARQSAPSQPRAQAPSRASQLEESLKMKLHAFTKEQAGGQPQQPPRPQSPRPQASKQMLESRRTEPAQANRKDPQDQRQQMARPASAAALARGQAPCKCSFRPATSNGRARTAEPEKTYASPLAMLHTSTRKNVSGGKFA